MLSDIFKANDIRGVVGEVLSEDLARRIGMTLAAQAAGTKRIALGRDGRLSSPMLAAALADGLRRGGMTVFDVGLIPTPVLYFAAAKHADSNGIMITGSHNPKNYNGMKILLNGKTIKGEDLQRLRRGVEEGSGDDGKDGDGGGDNKTLDITADYLAAVKDANPLNKPLRIVVDAGNGAAGECAPALYRAMGCEVIPLFCNIDGNFPNHHPDPSQPENLRDAAAALTQHDADLALLFDGDGDRLGALLPQPVFADRLLMLYARDLLSRQPGARVVFDVKCSSLLPPWIARHGGVADMQPTGHAFIKNQMQKTGALLGGEMSGHFYFRENWFGFDDALFAGARLLAILSNHPNAMDDIPDSFASPELLLDMHGKNQHDFVKQLRQTDIFPPTCRVVTIDGLRVEYENGFGLVRASNTTPSLVFRFEAANEKDICQIKKDFRRLLHAADPSLTLPF